MDQEYEFRIKAMKVTEKRLALMDIHEQWFSSNQGKHIEYSKENLKKGDAVKIHWYKSEDGEWNNISSVEKVLDINDDLPGGLKVTQPDSGKKQGKYSSEPQINMEKQRAIAYMSSLQRGTETVKMMIDIVGAEGFFGITNEKLLATLEQFVISVSEDYYMNIMKAGKGE